MFGRLVSDVSATSIGSVTVSGKPVCAWTIAVHLPAAEREPRGGAAIVEPRQLVAEAEHEAVPHVEQRVALLARERRVDRRLDRRSCTGSIGRASPPMFRPET